MSGMSKHVVNWGLHQGELVVDIALPQLHNIKTIYIISEVRDKYPFVLGIQITDI